MGNITQTISAYKMQYLLAHTLSGTTNYNWNCKNKPPAHYQNGVCILPSQSDYNQQLQISCQMYKANKNSFKARYSNYKTTFRHTSNIHLSEF